MKPNLKPKVVGYMAYQSLSELNRSMEQVVGVLKHLATFTFFERDLLKAYQIMTEEVRSMANEHILEVLREREFDNAAYYEHRRQQWQRKFEDPEEAALNSGLYKKQFSRKKRKQKLSKQTDRNK